VLFNISTSTSAAELGKSDDNYRGEANSKFPQKKELLMTAS